MNKYSLAFKITNWCNMNCAHCCECSGLHNAPNLMPIDDIKKYTKQFRALDVPKFEHMVFTGGEAMAPYFHGEMDYMSRCMDITFENAFVPFIKTNASWAYDAKMAPMILNDLAKSAYTHQMLVSLDVSVDEFHHNVNHVAELIDRVFSDQYLTPAIRITLVGLDTQKSRRALMELTLELHKRKLFVKAIDNGTLAVGRGQNIAHVYHDFNTPVSRIGRAAYNKLGIHTPTGIPHPVTGSCIQIDNAGMLTLNSRWAMPMSDMPLNFMMKKLIDNMNNQK